MPCKLPLIADSTKLASALRKIESHAASCLLAYPAYSDDVSDGLHTPPSTSAYDGHGGVDHTGETQETDETNDVEPNEELRHGLGSRVHILETDLVEAGVVAKKPTKPGNKREDQHTTQQPNHCTPLSSALGGQRLQTWHAVAMVSCPRYHTIV